MITKIAFLPRVLPAVFRLAPSVSASGYRMPHERFFFYGISVSALVHGVVLFGFPPTARPPVAIAIVKPAETPLKWTAVDVPPDPVPEVKAVKTPDDLEPESAADASAEGPRASIPDTFGPPTINPIAIPDLKLTGGSLPDASRESWIVPRTPRPGTTIGTGETFSLKDLDKAPVATNRVAPRYPFEMRRGGMNGKVVLRFIVDTRGEVSEVEILSADTPEFGKAAVEAMLRWKFRPGMKNNRRVNTRMELPMLFSLATAT